MSRPDLTASDFATIPTAPTASAGDNSTKLSTTAFVVTEKLTPRLQTVASSSSVTPTSDNEVIAVTALTVGITFANPTGTYAAHQSYIFAVYSAAAQTVAWGSSYVARTGSLPSTTVAGEWQYFTATYNATAGKHIILAGAAGGGGGGTTTNALTMNNAGSGDASGATFDGSAAKTISYDTIGAAPIASPTFTGTPVLTTTTTVGASGPVVGYRDIPLTVTNSTKTFALVDAGQGFGKDTTTARTYTIPANSSVAFPVGTAITVFNNAASGNVTIAITTDTMYLGGTATTGSRTLAPRGVCTLLKVASTVWIVSGAGLT